MFVRKSTGELGHDIGNYGGGMVGEAGVPRCCKSGSGVSRHSNDREEEQCDVIGLVVISGGGLSQWSHSNGEIWLI